MNNWFYENQTDNNTIPYISYDNNNLINNYVYLSLYIFFTLINLFFLCLQKTNIGKILNSLVDINNDKYTLIKLNNFINEYVKNDNIINKKNEIIKRRESLKDNSEIKELKQIDIEIE